MFAVVICPHIFEGTHIGLHISTQYEITKLRTLLPRLLVKDRNERYDEICAIFDYLMAPLPSELPHQGAIPRSPLGVVELPKTIKLIAGGSSVGSISFKPTTYYRKPLCVNLFDSSSSEDEDDPEVESVVAKNIDDDNHNAAQSGDTSGDADSSSYGNEDTRTTSKMGIHKQMEEIVLSGSEKESGTMILAETVLDSNTEYDWKIQHTRTMKKLEDRFNKEVHIHIPKQPPTVKDSNSGTTQAVASAFGERVLSRVDHNRLPIHL